MHEYNNTNCVFSNHISSVVHKLWFVLCVCVCVFVCVHACACVCESPQVLEVLHTLNGNNIDIVQMLQQHLPRQTILIEQCVYVCSHLCWLLCTYVYCVICNVYLRIWHCSQGSVEQYCNHTIIQEFIIL